MSRTLDDLRRAMHDHADDQHPPHPQTVLAGIEQRVAEHDRGRRHRVLGGVAAAAVAVAAIALGQGVGGEAPTPRPAETIGEDIEDTELATFPAYTRGLERLTLVEVPADGEPYQVEVEAAEDQQLYARAQCRYADGRREGTMAGLMVETNGTRSSVMCGTSVRAAQEPLPASDGALTITLDTEEELDGPAHLAVYRPSPWEEYPLDADDDGAPRSERDRSDYPLFPPGRTRFVAPPDKAAPNTTVTRTLQVTEGLTLSLSTTEPGQLRVLVDEMSVTEASLSYPLTVFENGNDDDWHTRWARMPALRDGYWTAWSSSGDERSFSLSPEQLSEQGLDVGPGDEVTLTIEARRFTDEGWQGVIRNAEALERLPRSDDLAAFPPDTPALRRLAVVDVPADGWAHPLPFDAPEDRPVYAVAHCTSADPRPTDSQTPTATIARGEHVTSITCRSGAVELEPGEPDEPATGAVLPQGALDVLAGNPHGVRMQVAVYEVVAGQGVPDNG